MEESLKIASQYHDFTSLVSICLCFFPVCFFFFLNTNIVVHYIIGKAGNELVSFFNSLYQDD